MKPLHAVTTTAFAVVAAFAGTGIAHAQTNPQSPQAPWAAQPYVGIDVARPTGSGSSKNLKVFGGVDFANRVGIEAGYVDFGSNRSSNVFDGGRYDSDTKAYAAYLAGKYTLPLAERVSAYGKLGVGYTHSEYNASFPDQGPYHYKNSDTGLYGGIGVQYQLTDKVALKAEYERFDKVNTNVLSLGVKVAF